MEIYVSTDVETDGPIPGVYSMLSIVSAAYLPDSNRPQSTFTANLETLPGAAQHPDTMKWWKTQPEAWASIAAMHEVSSNVFGYKNSPVVARCLSSAG